MLGGAENTGFGFWTPINNQSTCPAQAAPAHLSQSTDMAEFPGYTALYRTWRERSWPQSSYLRVGLWANSKVLFLFLYFWPHCPLLGALQPCMQGDEQQRGSHLTKGCSRLQFCMGPSCDPWDVGCSWGTSHPAQARNRANLYITPLPSKFLWEHYCHYRSSTHFLSPVSTSPTQPAAGSFATLSSRWLEADGGGHRVAFIFHLALPTFSSTPPWEDFWSPAQHCLLCWSHSCGLLPPAHHALHAAQPWKFPGLLWKFLC